jgi:hypothetical protein
MARQIAEGALRVGGLFANGLLLETAHGAG